jgi:hypothetical protein
MARMTKETQARVLGYTQKVAKHVNDGLSPNDSIVKVARAEDVEPGHIQLLVQAFNNTRMDMQRKSASSLHEKLAAFPLADSATILHELYPSNVKTAEARTFTDNVVSEEYSRAPVQLRPDHYSGSMMEKSASVVLDRKNQHPREDNYFTKKAYSLLKELRTQHDDRRRQLSDCADKVASALEDLKYYFQQNHHDYTLKEAYDTSLLAFGSRIAPIFEYVLQDMPHLVKQALDPETVGRAYTMRGLQHLFSPEGQKAIRSREPLQFPPALDAPYANWRGRTSQADQTAANIAGTHHAMFGPERSLATERKIGLKPEGHGVLPASLQKDPTALAMKPEAMKDPLTAGALRDYAGDKGIHIPAEHFKQALSPELKARAGGVRYAQSAPDYSTVNPLWQRSRSESARLHRAIPRVLTVPGQSDHNHYLNEDSPQYQAWRNHRTGMDEAAEAQPNRPLSLAGQRLASGNVGFGVLPAALQKDPTANSMKANAIQDPLAAGALRDYAGDRGIHIPAEHFKTSNYRPFNRNTAPFNIVEKILEKSAEYDELKSAMIEFNKEASDASEKVLSHFMPPVVRHVFNKEAVSGAEVIEERLGGLNDNSLYNDIINSTTPPTSGKLKSKAYLDVNDPNHMQQLETIKKKSMLAGLLNHDPFLRGESPSKVTNLYNQMSGMAPRATGQPLVTKALLKRYLAQGGAETHDLDQLVGLENKMKINQDPMRAYNLPTLPGNLTGEK